MLPFLPNVGVNEQAMSYTIWYCVAPYGDYTNKDGTGKIFFKEKNKNIFIVLIYMELFI